MITFKKFITKEEVGSSVGTTVGSIAGSGDKRLPPDQREPGLTPKMVSNYQKRNKEGAKEQEATVAAMVRRNVPNR